MRLFPRHSTKSLPITFPGFRKPLSTGPVCGKELTFSAYYEKQTGVILPDTLVIAEEFSEWDESRRRIDLLGLEKDANLVVIELKRTEDGGHMELQAIRNRIRHDHRRLQG